MLQWEQHQDLRETCIFFLIALVVERGRLALKYSTSRKEGECGRFVHLKVNISAAPI